MNRLQRIVFIIGFIAGQTIPIIKLWIQLQRWKLYSVYLRLNEWYWKRRTKKALKRLDES